MEVSGENGVKRRSWEAFQGTWKGRKNATVQVPKFDTYGSLIMTSHQIGPKCYLFMFPFLILIVLTV